MYPLTAIQPTVPANPHSLQYHSYLISHAKLDTGTYHVHNKEIPEEDVYM